MCIITAEAVGVEVTADSLPMAHVRLAWTRRRARRVRVLESGSSGITIVRVAHISDWNCFLVRTGLQRPSYFERRSLRPGADDRGVAAVSARNRTGCHRPH